MIFKQAGSLGWRCSERDDETLYDLELIGRHPLLAVYACGLEGTLRSLDGFETLPHWWTWV